MFRCNSNKNMLIELTMRQLSQVSGSILNEGSIEGTYNIKKKITPDLV